MNASRARMSWSRLAAVLVAATMLSLSSGSRAAVYLSVSVAPPILPVYAQPLIPGPGYIWAPGYWAWGPDGFYWIPGTWVLAPFVGALWTPGYWAWNDGLYWWHPGYWGRHVGFYGGIDYGFGYTGYGYHGGYWNRGVFTYNRAVNNVTNIRNITVYNTTVVNNTRVTRVSYNGGPNGIVARPTAQDRIAERDAHTPLLPVQSRHELAAHANRAMLASVNGGNPRVTATARPQSFSAAGASPARSFSQQAAVRPSAATRRGDVAGPNVRPPNERRAERREGPANADARQLHGPQPRAEMRAQEPARPHVQAQRQMPPREQMQRPMPSPAIEHRQPPMRPQGEMRAPAQAQGGGHREGPPQGRGRGERGERQDERQ